MFKNVKIINVWDWNKLVQSTYNRIYNFQQQDGCQDRGIFRFSLPEVINGGVMGIKFAKWLERDPKQPIPNQKYDYELELFWKRNFYPNIYVIISDLYKKGLLEDDDYCINIDW